MSDVTVREMPKWDNDDLVEYYNNIPIKELKSYTVIGGFDNCCDLDLIRKEINQSKNILEVGAGYGRVIKNILDSGYDKKITGIERCKKFCSYMQNLFNNKAEIIHGDIRLFKPNKKFDLILLMWSNISEYPKNQQLGILSHLKELLQDNGILIIETFNHYTEPNNTQDFQFFKSKQSYFVDCEYGKAYGYIPSDEEIRQYGITLKFKSIKQIPYSTRTDRKRLITIFS